MSEMLRTEELLMTSKADALQMRLDIDDMRVKHLEFVQAVISRTSSNSAHTKQIALSIVAASIAASIGVAKPQICFVIPLLLAGFVFVDAQFLSLERGFRRLFDEVRLEQAPKRADFRVHPIRAVGPARDMLNAALSWSIAPFYTLVALGSMTIGFVL